MKSDDLFVQTINDEDLELPPPEKKYIILLLILLYNNNNI